MFSYEKNFNDYIHRIIKNKKIKKQIMQNNVK